MLLSHVTVYRPIRRMQQNGFGTLETVVRIHTDQNPTHNYSKPGSYTVTLKASNTHGTDSKDITINVMKATPIITWSNPADIIYGTALNSTQLNATASVLWNFRLYSSIRN